eukprot:m.536348 g.536348  ORF g.536348 m.536348 type:complete len:409 (+) comp22071_c0_seq9:173-1399(+)
MFSTSRNGLNGTMTINFTRVSDGHQLTTITPHIGPAASTAGYRAMGMELTNDGSAVYGLGQLENTSAHGGCDGNGTTATGFPLRRNGLPPASLAASKFHVSVPFTYSSSGWGFLLNLPGDGTVSVAIDGSMQWNVTTQQQLDFWITTTAADPAPRAQNSQSATPTPRDGKGGHVRSGAGLPRPPSTSVRPSPASVYAQYADAVGHAPLLPTHAARFWQSRLRYRTQEIVQSIAQEYNARNLTLGMLVVDFMNQRTDGDFHMNPVCFPNITNMTTAVRALTDAHTMVSFWPDVRSTADAFAALTKEGCVLDGTIDPTGRHCRQFIWNNYVLPNYVARGVTDFWLDEDDIHSIAPILNSSSGGTCMSRPVCGANYVGDGTTKPYTVHNETRRILAYLLNGTFCKAHHARV